MKCKNCENEATEVYCGKCGQEVETHRLSLKHFLAHDIAHGLFHIDRSLPKTLKTILLNPGKVAHEYIAGKRKKYYSFFYLLLMLLGVYLFVDSMIPHEVTEEHSSDKFSQFIDEHFKTIVFLIIPFIASVSWLLFRRLKYNLIEFHVFGVVVLIGYMSILVVEIVISLLFHKLQLENSIVYEFFSDAMLFTAIVLYPLYAFFSIIRKQYSLLGKIWRALSVWFMIMFLFLLTTGITAVVLMLKDVKTKGVTFKEYIKMEKSERKKLDSLNKPPLIINRKKPEAKPRD